MTGLEQRLARIIEDHDAGLHDSIEETGIFGYIRTARSAPWIFA